MSTWKGLKVRLRGLLRSRQVDAELNEEVAFHLEMETARNERAGMSAAEARRQALLKFGGTERYQEQHRDGRSFGWIEDLVRDLRYGIRGFVRAPVFALTAILTLGIAIGAGAIVFSLVNGLLLRPFPVAHPDRLVAVWEAEQEHARDCNRGGSRRCPARRAAHGVAPVRGAAA